MASDDDDLRERVLAYMREHTLKAPAMARHCDVPLDTLKCILYKQTQSPRVATRERIEAAIKLPPPARPLPKHGERILALWGKVSSDAIGEELGITGAAVRRVAATMGIAKRRNGSDGRTTQLAQR